MSFICPTDSVSKEFCKYQHRIAMKAIILNMLNDIAFI